MEATGFLCEEICIRANFHHAIANKNALWDFMNGWE